MLKFINSHTTESKIQALEYASMACIIPMFYFISFGSVKSIILVGFIASLLQIPIYILYKSIHQQDEYLKNKAGALAVAGLLMIYLLVKHNL